MGRLRLAAASTLGVWALDWSLKAAHPLLWSGWVPHYTSRSFGFLFLALACLCFVVPILGTLPAAIAGGVAFGGMCANTVDLAVNGMVWNMIPIPWTDGFWCNVADFAIVGGLAVLFVSAGRFAMKEITS